MKKLLLFALLIVVGLQSNAQTVSLALITAPCDSNGVVVATFTGMPTPCDVTWYYGASSYVSHLGVTATTDTLYGYCGSNVYVNGYNSTTGASASNNAVYPEPFTVNVSIASAVCPALSSATATTIGATGPFTYKWISTSPTYSVVSTTNPASLADGSYKIRVKDAATGCVSGYNDSMTYVYSTVPFSIDVTSTTPVCPALSNATINFTGSGTAPYTYSWYNPTAGTVAATTNPATLAAGVYDVTATDAGGCSAYTYTEIVITPDFTQTVSVTPAVCPGLGSGIVSVTGGTAPFTYSWTNVLTGVITSGSASTVALPPCFYTETTTDALGCSVFGGSWSVGYVPNFTGTVTTTPANCTNGTASVTITGGTGPFTYLWSNGATTSSITGLVTGNYDVKVTDGLGCVDSSVIDSGLYGFVDQAVTIGVYDVTTPATCIDSNGSIIAFGSGGTPPYSYLWSNGGTTQSIGSLASNYYDVTVTDANGCLGWGGDYVSSSTPISVTYSSTPSLCHVATGTASLTISGGTAPYTVTWYTYPAQTGTTATALSPGNYYFFITDAMGCTQHGSVYVPPINVISLSFSSSPATCLAADGSVSVSASGGAGAYHYSWSSGGATPTLTGITSGWYYATVTDDSGCVATNCQYVPFNSPITLGVSTSPASCIYNHDGSITATAAFGTAPYTFSMGGSSSGTVTIPGLATNPYWITVTDAIGCTATQYTYVDYNVSDSSCFCVIQGTVFTDPNHNCLQDGAEPGINHIQMHCTGLGYTYTDASGNYSFLAPTGSYTVSQTVLAIYPLSPCQPNNIPVTVTAASGCHHIVNFADTLNPIHDMHISTWDYTPARPGFPYTQVTVVTNDGTVSEPNVLSGYKSDPAIFSPGFVPAGIFTGSGSYYSTPGSFPTLVAGDGIEFHENYSVPVDVPLGTSLIFMDSAVSASPMTSWVSDYSPWNNVNYFTTTTVGSYDPNFKEVSPKGWGTDGVITTNDSVLEYMVHFQNTGSYLAENVVVRDTLNANLDWTSLRPVYSSKKCVVDIDESGRATFTFEHINLPPSSTEPVASNAMFTYTIKQRPSLAMGTHIKNSASIYFDFNAPIKTNATLNTIGWPTGVPNTTTGTAADNVFTVYPNPANSTFSATINSSEGGTYGLKVSDVAGKTQLAKSLTLQKGSQTVTVDVSHLTPGVYFITLADGDGKTETQKLVIMK